LYDERIEEIPLDDPTDLVAITVETYTARRAYEIAAEYRIRGVPVVMGGMQPTLIPDEVKPHADAIFIGDAESQWAQVFQDAFVTLVFQQPVHQFPARIYFIALLIHLFAGQQHLGFDAHQRGCHDNKFGGNIHAQFIHPVHVTQKIVRDPGNGDVINIQLIPLNEEEQQVERAFEGRKFYGECLLQTGESLIS
jgi:hypothetical protein